MYELIEAMLLCVSIFKLSSQGPWIAIQKPNLAEDMNLISIGQHSWSTHSASVVSLLLHRLVSAVNKLHYGGQAGLWSLQTGEPHKIKYCIQP